MPSSPTLAKSRLRLPPSPSPTPTIPSPASSPEPNSNSPRGRTTSQPALTRPHFPQLSFKEGPWLLTRLIQAALMGIPGVLILVWLLWKVPPERISDWPLPLWYGPLHLVSFWIVWQSIGQLTKSWRQATLVAAFWQSWWFLKLQQVVLSWEVAVVLLVLFGTIELCANLFTRFSRLRSRRAPTPAIFGSGRPASSSTHRRVSERLSDSN